jgi:hypothetical protein
MWRALPLRNIYTLRYIWYICYNIKDKLTIWKLLENLLMYR